MRMGVGTARPHPGSEGEDLAPQSVNAVSPAWAWLRAHEGLPRFGFLRRDGTGLLGAGVLEQVAGASIAEVLELTRQRGGTWFVGGSFDPGAERAAWWQPFGAARAWRPREVFALPGGGRRDVPQTPMRTSGGPTPGRTPDRPEWGRMIAAAVEAIAKGDLEKVVLARSIVESTDIDALGWLQGPRSARDMAFLFEPEPGLAFAGLTPELLFERQGDRLRSEALAGTDVNTPTGRERLLSSDKDAREHALVVRAVAKRLAPFCDEVQRSPLQLAEMGRLVHRLVSFEGRLDDRMSDADIASSLHPTPAVAGTPCEAALEFLREHEPFDRGWYAGPVGLVEPDRTTLSVALRCALWHGATRIAYTGAGIVEGSVADAEWEETELKSRVVRNR